jgi:hypothetical protein
LVLNNFLLLMFSNNLSCKYCHILVYHQNKEFFFYDNFQYLYMHLLHNNHLLLVSLLLLDDLYFMLYNISFTYMIEIPCIEDSLLYHLPF